MVNIQEYVNIKDFATLRVGGQFRYFVIISSKEDLMDVCTTVKTDLIYKNSPIFVLGGGSNIVFSDGVLEIFALKIEIKGFEVIADTSEYMDIKVGAGENWDQIVEKTVEMNLSGLESLSLIPGTVGAGPVQNIGAYGSEVKDTILEIEVFDIKKCVIKTILNKDCNFGYRDSIFKKEAKGKYVITAVIYRLNKNFQSASHSLEYPGVIKYFEDRDMKNPSLLQIRDAIIYIRRTKLPNPNEIPNVGSFFKNPIVQNAVANKIKMEHPNVKLFPIDENYTKIPAGWLIENAGLKGTFFGKISIYNNNALVLVNTSDATCEEVINARNEIIKIVKDRFGIELVQEPEIV